MKSSFRKYVHKSHNKWAVQKHINGKLKTFKRFKKLNDAIDYRDQLIKNNWKELPKTPEEIEAEQSKEYYKHIMLNRCIKTL